MRFADNELLKTMLGVEQGHLSLFAKMNDPENKVQVIIDKRLLDAPTVSLHPLINTSSTIISHEDFLLFANKYAPGYRVMEFSFVSTIIRFTFIVHSYHTSTHRNKESIWKYQRLFRMFRMNRN